MSEFKALGFVLIISPSSKLEIMHYLFCWIPYSFKNYLIKFENFLSTGLIDWGPAHPVRRISIKVHYLSKFEFEALELVLVISPSYELGIALHFFFLDSLFFKKNSIKFSKLFPARSTSWHLVQPVHRVSLYGALIFVVLEPKSYMAQAHKLQIDLGSFLGPFWSLIWVPCSPP